MTEYVKKSDVLELLSLPKDLIAEYVCDLKGLWIDDDQAEQTEPNISCSTCGYSPQTPSCDTCEGYSNWYALDPCEECVFVKGTRWCDNCNGKPKGLDALPNSRKAEQTEPQREVENDKP